MVHRLWGCHKTGRGTAWKQGSCSSALEIDCPGQWITVDATENGQWRYLRGLDALAQQTILFEYSFIFPLILSIIQNGYYISYLIIIISATWTCNIFWMMPASQACTLQYMYTDKYHELWYLSVYINCGLGSLTSFKIYSMFKLILMRYS